MLRNKRKAMSEQHLDPLIPFIIEGWGLLVVGIIGIAGNVGAIYVFGRKRRYQRTFHSLMLALAVIDMTYIISMMLVFTVPQFSVGYKNDGYPWVLPWALPIIQTCLTGSIYFTMAITVERYLAVCHPFYRVTHSWPPRYFVIPILVFSFVYNLPKFFELHTILVPVQNFPQANGTSTNQTSAWSAQNTTMQAVATGTSLRFNKYYYKVYLTWMNLILMGIGPFILLITLNVLMLLQLMEFGKDRCLSPQNNGHSNGELNNRSSGTSRGQRKEVVLAKISLAIVLVFIVCHSIKWIPNIYELLHVSSF